MQNDQKPLALFYICLHKSRDYDEIIKEKKRKMERERQRTHCERATKQTLRKTTTTTSAVVATMIAGTTVTFWTWKVYLGCFGDPLGEIFFFFRRSFRLPENSVNRLSGHLENGTIWMLQDNILVYGRDVEKRLVSSLLNCIKQQFLRPVGLIKLFHGFFVLLPFFPHFSALFTFSSRFENACPFSPSIHFGSIFLQFVWCMFLFFFFSRACASVSNVFQIGFSSEFCLN